jgi:hypothetical protein
MNMDNSLLLGTSPTAVAGSRAIAFRVGAAHRDLKQKKEQEQDTEIREVGFEDFLSKIPDVIQRRKEVNAPHGSKKDPVNQLFE